MIMIMKKTDRQAGDPRVSRLETSSASRGIGIGM